MNILITGSRGLVGSSLKKIINDEKSSRCNTYIFIDRDTCDLKNIDDLKLIFKRYNPDVVVHLASRVGGVYANINSNYEFLIDNITINMNIVECCRIYNVKKLINILSTCIFPDQNITYPLTSEQLHNGLPHYSNIGYSYSKRILHLLSGLLSTNSKIQVINLIPTNLYGENDNYNLQDSHVIPALIHKTFLSFKNRTPLEIMGDGSAVRQFLYVDDLSKIILHFIAKDYDTKIINMITSPPMNEEISIKQLVKLIYSQVYGHFDESNIKYNLGVNGQHKKTTTDTDIRQYIPDFQFTSLTKGLENTINYFKEHYDVIRK